MRQMLLAFILITFFLDTGAADAAEMKAKLDFTADVKMLRRFKKDGPGADKTIHLEPEGFYFWYEPAFKDLKQTGLYSDFTLTGDFEITVNYEWHTTAAPKTGYGISCGIAVECEGRKIALARGFQIGAGESYLVTEKLPGKDYKTEPTPTTATKGKLVLRREKSLVTCLATQGDGPLEVIKEEIPFTAASVRKVRLFADPGGAPNAFEARLTGIRIQAEDILGDIPVRERTSNLGSWLTGAGLVIAAVAGYLGYRRWRDDKWLWTRE